MSNIFDGIKKMTDDEIRVQLACLRNVTFMNAAKETGRRVLRGLADIANSVTEAFNRQSFFNYQIVKVSDIVHDEVDRLKANDRIQLEYELKKALVEKCNELSADVLKYDDSDDRISVVLLNETAKLYGIDKYKTPANKIEETSVEYNKVYLQQLHNMLVHQSPDEVKKTDASLQAFLNAADMDTKRQLQKCLMPKEFSGKGIGRILRLERTTKYLSYTVDLLGYACFDDISVNISVAYNSIKSLKRVQRVLLAGFVWRLRSAYAKKFTVDKTILPGYIPAQNQSEYDAKDREFRRLLEERISTQKRLAECENKIENLAKKIEESKERLELETREYDELQKKFMSLENKKDEFVSGSKPEAETKEYYNEVNSTKRELDREKEYYDKYSHELESSRAQMRELQQEKESVSQTFEMAKSQTDEQVNAMSLLLMNKWRAYFYKFSFSSELFENVVIDFTLREQLYIEEMLKEMHDCSDIDAFAAESGNGSKKAYCYVSKEKNAFIEYEGMSIINIAKA